MLTELQIKNFAIIEEQTVSFVSGLNVITGETGAGKSIILNALEFLLGGKSSADNIRQGEDSLEVTAVFEIEMQMFEILPEIARVNELMVSRSYYSNGKNKVFINGKVATVSLLKEITEKIITLCGQSEFVRLLDPKFHISIIDNYGEHKQLLAEYQGLYSDWLNTKNEYHKLLDDNAKIQIQREQLELILEDLNQLSPAIGLREHLTNKINLFKNSENLKEIFHKLNLMFEGDGCVLDQVKNIHSLLSDACKLDSGISALLSKVDLILDNSNELYSEVESYGQEIDVNDVELDQLRNRLSELARLERKYKTNDEGLAHLYDDAKQKLLAVNSSDTSIAKLETQLRKCEQDLLSIGREISKRRRTAAEKLSRTVSVELAELAMKSAVLKFDFIEVDPTATGIDSGEFKFSANKGEGLKPLKNIASGGELSRLTLVIKKLIKEERGVNVLVFDEVDTGVSGSVARAVGQKLKDLGKNSQVICITHIPQVASLADQHLFVFKNSAERTRSAVKVLTVNERTEEIARMLSGDKITKASLKAAEELLG